MAIFRAKSRIDSVIDTINEKIINVTHGFSFREFNASRNVDISMSAENSKGSTWWSSMYTIYTRLFKILFDDSGFESKSG